MIPGLHLSDVSEFQRVNWAAYAQGRQAAIVRVCYGAFHPDLQWGVNLAGVRTHVPVRGYYQYLVAGQDPAIQANAFCDLMGALQPNEFVVLDHEEGSGNQVPRAQAWCAVVDARLQTKAWIYTYVPFASAYLGGLAAFGDRPHWLAGYGPEPSLGHSAWQHTDGQYADISCQPAPGVTDANGHISNCDCSVFRGTIDDLSALVNHGVAVPTQGEEDVPYPANAVVRRVACPNPDHSVGELVLHADGGVNFNGLTPGYFPNYIAIANDGCRYAFGPSRNGGVLAYPALPATLRQGSRYFVDLWLG